MSVVSFMIVHTSSTIYYDLVACFMIDGLAWKNDTFKTKWNWII